jgi:FHS family Na+ dependent glucose MFS transporter 1
LKTTKLPPLALYQTIGYFAGLFVLGLFSSVLGPTLPGLAELTRVPLAQISLLFTLRSFGYMIGSLFGGYLYDHKSGHKVLVIALCVMGIAYFFIPVTPLLVLLLGLMFLVGASEGTLDVGSNTLLVWVHRHKVGPYMNALHFFFGIGAFMGPVIIAQVLGLSGSITAAYWIVGVCALPVAVWVARLASPSIQDDPTKDVQNGDSSPWLLMLVVLFFFLYVGAEVAYGGWIYTYTLTLNLASAANSAYLTSLFWGSFMAGRLVGIPIAARFSAYRVLTVDLLGCLASILLLVIWPESITAVILCTIGIGLSMASIFPTTIVWVERQMTITGRSARWFFVAAGAGGMFLPWLVGQYFETVGPQVMTWFIIVDLLVCTAIFAILVLYSRSLKRQSRAV